MEEKLQWVKLYGLQIWPIHLQGPTEQKPFKILEKTEHGRIQGLLYFLSTPYYLRKGVKLRISNFVRTFI